MPRSRHSALPSTAVRDPGDEDEFRPPSKSQLKRQMTALQELGERLVGLPDSKLRQLPLAERLYDAVREAQRITSHEARRRQLQYVGKLMRDARIEPIQAMLAEWDGESMEQIAAFHQLELWRDRLLADDQYVTAFMNQYPHAEAQPLRALIRAARKEQAANAALLPGREPQRKHYRALFQEIKRLQAAADAASPSLPDDDEDGDDET
ncbi:MAG: ribosome biogenesis factor YjgA [Pigmentiphaga sp.]|uniref:ribosome biogenesis factor YjgA n=1 Tax=Pigmentiphaga sp. TaxID=1977564 RepID=UPI0029B5054C|nr:ribosome biogenesis factor YjgA [Pigmentiphaga sp.]MDX3906660.1 ribosome biogenesis factor YjgA [Pigmentiphaga sp.]